MIDFHLIFLERVKHSTLNLIYKIMDSNKDKFDLGNNPKNHFLYDTSNNKTVNDFKTIRLQYRQQQLSVYDSNHIVFFESKKL